MGHVSAAGEHVHLGERIRGVIRQEGMGGILSRFKRDLESGIRICDGYIFCLNHADAAPPRPIDGIVVEELVQPGPEDCAEIARPYFHVNTPEEVLQFLSEGQRCFAARRGQRIVSWFWVTRKDFYDYHLHREIRLSQEEDYFLGSYTVPEYRGNGLIEALVLEAIRRLAGENPAPGRRAVAFVDVKNQSSIRACRKMGFQVIGHIGYVGVFGFKLNYILGRDVLPKTRPRFQLTR